MKKSILALTLLTSLSTSVVANEVDYLVVSNDTDHTITLNDEIQAQASAFKSYTNEALASENPQDAVKSMFKHESRYDIVIAVNSEVESLHTRSKCSENSCSSSTENVTDETTKVHIYDSKTGKVHKKFLNVKEDGLGFGGFGLIDDLTGYKSESVVRAQEVIAFYNEVKNK